MDGKAFFSEMDAFNHWILNHTSAEEVRQHKSHRTNAAHGQAQISTCSGFSAMLGALVKKLIGLRFAGVGAVSCRHQLFMALGMVDIAKGERYVQSYIFGIQVCLSRACRFDLMDYATAAALTANERRRAVQRMVDTYDINCQYWKNFWKRMDELPQHMQLDEALKLLFKIPHFHLYGHENKCQSGFALHFTELVGMLDGEHVERLWAILNSTAPSTMEQGPGARADQLNDHCNHNNYRKIVDMGEFHVGLGFRDRQLTGSSQESTSSDVWSKSCPWRWFCVATSRGSTRLCASNIPSRFSSGRLS